MKEKKKILLICGSNNQTIMMHKIGMHLSDHDCYYTPYYCDGFLKLLYKANMLSFTVIGKHHQQKAIEYCSMHGLKIDFGGDSNDYDLVITSSDLIIQKNIRNKKIVLVQEGMTDPVNIFYYLSKYLGLPRYMASTSTAGLSHAYDRFFVASQGYAELFINKGCDASKISVTGIPNFDNVNEFRENSFPYKNFVLAATSDARETFKYENRKKFIYKAMDIASGRQLIFKLHPNENFSRAVNEIKKADIIFIPALAGDLKVALTLNSGILPWIKEQHARGAEIASLCLGAFLLAETGLLNDGKCSTHWGFAREFRLMYPDVELVDGGIITESNGIYSSGGANSYWNLLLHLVEKHTSREISILVAKYFAVDIDRESQSSFSIFQGQKTHPDRIILKAQELIEKSINKKISVEDIAEQLALGRRSLERRFKSATGNSVLEYIQRVKMEVAKRNFETSMKTIHEVMYAIGYNDIKAFRTTFKKITGITPVAYRNKYLKRIN